MPYPLLPPPSLLSISVVAKAPNNRTWAGRGPPGDPNQIFHPPGSEIDYAARPGVGASDQHPPQPPTPSPPASLAQNKMFVFLRARAACGSQMDNVYRARAVPPPDWLCLVGLKQPTNVETPFRESFHLWTQATKYWPLAASPMTHWGFFSNRSFTLLGNNDKFLHQFMDPWMVPFQVSL